jgi:capsular polysaccharide export protein
MRLLFFAVTKHQYRYFKKLQAHLHAKSEVLFFPSPALSLRGFFKKGIDTEDILSQKFRELDVKYQNRLIRWLYKRFLRLQVPFVIAAVSRAIEKYDPDFLLFWNGKKFHQAIALKVAHSYGKACAFFENGLLPDTTQFDFQGVNASNSVPREAAFYRSVQLPNSCTLPKRLQERKSKREMQRAHHEALPQRYIFVPFQVAYDTQIIQHSPWIKDMLLFFDLVCYLAQKSGYAFVIKEHPSDRVSDYSQLRKHAPDNIYFSQENTQRLIENADAIMTINSTVGIEGLLFKKRVIVLGEAFFAIEGIVKTAHNREKLLQIIKDLAQWQPDGALIENFLKYLQCVYLIPDNWRNPTQRHYDAIEKRLEERLHAI